VILSGSGFKDIKTGDTLCDENTQLFLSQWNFLRQ
jgi:hypothetical protein